MGKFSSVQFKMVSVRSKKSTCAQPRLSEVSPRLPTVPMFVRRTMAICRPFKEDRLALPVSTPFSSRRSMVCECAWLCACRYCLKVLNTLDLPRSKPCGACFARQSICLVISLHSGMSRVVHSGGAGLHILKLRTVVFHTDSVLKGASVFC